MLCSARLGVPVVPHCGLLLNDSDIARHILQLGCISCTGPPVGLCSAARHGGYAGSPIARSRSATPGLVHPLQSRPQPGNGSDDGHPRERAVLAHVVQCGNPCALPRAVRRAEAPIDGGAERPSSYTTTEPGTCRGRSPSRRMSRGVYSEVQRVDDIEEMGGDERESRLVIFITVSYRHLPSHRINTAPSNMTNSRRR